MFDVNFTNNSKELFLNEKIGSFAAYIRKNINSQQGVKTQFFGEDGEDADIISALSQTKFKGLEVGINVYWIKNGLGQNMINEKGVYPIITSFIANINRPKPSSHDDGMIAEFFVHDGENSDKANKLNESKYKDSLVFVDIRGKLMFKSPNIYEEENQENIIENHSWKVLEKEKKEYEKSAKKYLKTNISLHEENTFTNHKLIEIINSNKNGYPKIYDYMKKESCIFKKDGHVCKSEREITPIKFKNNNFDFFYLPFCDQHHQIINNAIEKDDFSCIDHKEIYLETQYIRLLNKWVWGFFIKNFSLTGKEEPNSIKILSWFQENNIEDVLPPKFKKDVMILINKKGNQ